MYKLTLTPAERRVINWIGDRYRHGHELYSLLCRGDWTVEDGELSADWDCANDLTISLSENVSWEVRDLIEDTFNETGLACFDDSLRFKLYDFTNVIV